MKKKKYIIPIVIGFLFLFGIVMGISTYFVTMQYQEQFIHDYTDVVFGLQERLYDVKEEEISSEYLGTLISQKIISLTDKDCQQYSVAIYDDRGNKVTQMGNYLVLGCDYLDEDHQNKFKEFYFRLEDYLKEEEIEKFKQFYLESYSDSPNFKWTLDRKYTISGVIDKEKEELLALYVTDEAMTDGVFSTWDAFEPIFWWMNPKYKQHGSAYQAGSFITPDGNLVFPYLYDGEHYYNKWIENEYLQEWQDEREMLNGFPRQYENEHLSSFSATTASGEEVFYWLILREESKPLLAAMNELKYIYIVTFCIMLACMIKVVFTARETYKKQVEMERTRQEFTARVAQELENPLDVIRESLVRLECNEQDISRDDELKKVIQQTETMDEMVQEMIQIAKKPVV